MPSYEIRDISPPRGVKQAMEMQAKAERRKRAQILESEGVRQANINIADGHMSAEILASQGDKQALINKAQDQVPVHIPVPACMVFRNLWNQLQIRKQRSSRVS